MPFGTNDGLPFFYITVQQIVRLIGNIKVIRKNVRKETIEQVFADAKEKHAMRYTQYRGLAKVKAEATLRFACMNLKKLAKRNRIKGLFGPFICGFIQILAQVIQKSVANPMLQPILSTVRAPSPRELST